MGLGFDSIPSQPFNWCMTRVGCRVEGAHYYNLQEVVGSRLVANKRNVVDTNLRCESRFMVGHICVEVGSNSINRPFGSNSQHYPINLDCVLS